MTRRELYYYIKGHGCIEVFLPEGAARCVYFENPKTNGYATLNTPIDDREVYPTTVRAICLGLGIELPPNQQPPSFSHN